MPFKQTANKLLKTEFPRRRNTFYAAEQGLISIPGIGRRRGPAGVIGALNQRIAQAKDYQPSPTDNIIGMEHTSNSYMFFNTFDKSGSPEGTWYLLMAKDSDDDYFLYRQDFKGETTGLFAGDNGEWSICIDNLGADINPEHRASCRLDAYWDPVLGILMILSPHISTPNYTQWNWDAATKRFNRDATITDVDAGSHCSPASSNGNRPVSIVDTEGRYLVAAIHSSDRAIVKYTGTDRTSMTAFVTLESSMGSTSNLRICIFRFKKIVSSVLEDCTGVVWGNDSTGEMRFAWKKDSDPMTLGSFSFETIEASNARVDDHCFVQAAVLDGDTESTLFLARKAEQPGVQSVVFQFRDPSTGWGGKQIIETSDSYSRPKLFIDTRNGLIYLFYVDNVTNFEIYYRVADIATKTFGARTTLISASINNMLGPQTPRESTEVPFYFPIIGFEHIPSSGNPIYWYNSITI